jgi:hypothetical protein
VRWGLGLGGQSFPLGSPIINRAMLSSAAPKGRRFWVGRMKSFDAFSDSGAVFVDNTPLGCVVTSDIVLVSIEADCIWFDGMGSVVGQQSCLHHDSTCDCHD